MARLTHVQEDSPGIDADLLRAIQARRGGTLLNLDRQLLHSAPLARGWNALMGAIRGQTQLDGALRELVILRVAVLNRAPYEFAQHAPVALAEGLTQGQVDAVADWSDSTLFDARARDVLAYADAMTLQVQVDAVADWQRSTLFDARARDVLAYADAMTLQVQVPKELFDTLRSHLDDRELVELTATVAAYNMVSRFLEALQIEIED